MESILSVFHDMQRFGAIDDFTLIVDKRTRTSLRPSSSRHIKKSLEKQLFTISKRYFDEGSCSTKVHVILISIFIQFWTVLDDVTYQKIVARRRLLSGSSCALALLHSTMDEPPANKDHASESSAEAVVGHALTTEIQESLQKVKELQERVRILKEQHHRQVWKATLLCDAEDAYETMSRRDMWKKENVLLALKSDVVPYFMRWEENCFHSSFPSRLCIDREVLLARLELDGFEEAFMDKAYCVPRCFRNDKEVMLAICAKNSHALALASERLRNDPDVVLAAVQQRFHLAPLALQYASAKLRGNRKIVRAALNQAHGIRCFMYVSPSLQNDNRLALNSILCSSEECDRVYEHLSHLSEEMREDYDVSWTPL